MHKLSYRPCDSPSAHTPPSQRVAPGKQRSLASVQDSPASRWRKHFVVVMSGGPSMQEYPALQPPIAHASPGPGGWRQTSGSTEASQKSESAHHVATPVQL